jgi:hypothetical protein
MHLKVFVKLKKTLKTLSSEQKNPKKPKKPQKPKKTPKNPLGWVFLQKPGFFPILIVGNGASDRLNTCRKVPLKVNVC